MMIDNLNNKNQEIKVNFPITKTVKISEYLEKIINDNVVDKDNVDRFDSSSHFIRCAILVFNDILITVNRSKAKSIHEAIDKFKD